MHASRDDDADSDSEDDCRTTMRENGDGAVMVEAGVTVRHRRRAHDEATLEL